VCRAPGAVLTLASGGHHGPPAVRASESAGGDREHRVGDALGRMYEKTTHEAPDCGGRGGRILHWRYIDSAARSSFRAIAEPGCQ